VAIAALALLLAPRGLPGRWLGVVGLVPLFVVAPGALKAGDVEVVVLDVGQGVSALIRTAHHALLYDTGPQFGTGADSGSRIIVPYLRAAGVRRLDGLVVSHDDDDHWGGAASVLQALPVDWLLTSLPDLDPLVVQAGPGLRCAAGQSWEWDGVRFEVLHPARESYGDPTVRDNDRSCVLAVGAPGGRVLLPADIERRSEEGLLRGARGKLRADVLLAPHQGSRTSSLPDFVDAVGARVVVFPVGYRNRFGHPHRDILRRYAESGARIFRTDRDGAITARLEPQGVTVSRYREDERRYWR